VFERTAGYPDGSLERYQQTSLIVNISLIMVIKIHLVIRHPAPVFRHDQRRSGRQMHQQERTPALRVRAVGFTRYRRAVVRLQQRAIHAADAEVRVLHAYSSRSRASQVPLYDDVAWSGAASLEEHVCDLNGSPCRPAC
jgi:hypothetical protein